MTQPRILAFAGSARRDSFNKKLVNAAAQGARDAGAEVTVVDLADYPMPLFDQDLEASEGMPETVRAFKKLMDEHDGFLISCPEYNGSITPLLKNTIDWCSRAEAEGERPSAVYQGKAAALLAASPGGLGGLRGLVHVRSILQGIGVMVLPQQMAVSGASKAFDEDGNLSDEKTRSRVEGVAGALAGLLAKLKG